MISPSTQWTGIMKLSEWKNINDMSFNQVIRSDFFRIIIAMCLTACAWARYIWWNLKVCNFAFFEHRFWHLVFTSAAFHNWPNDIIFSQLFTIRQKAMVYFHLNYFCFSFSISNSKWLFTGNLLGYYYGKVSWNWTMILFLEHFSLYSPFSNSGTLWQCMGETVI